MKHITSIVAALLCAGCASQILVWDEDKTPLVGVPFRAAEVYIKTGLRNEHSEGGACTPTPFAAQVSLPTGAQYYANVDAADLAKTGFVMKFADNGALSEISLNTEPVAADQIKGAVEALIAATTAFGITEASPTAEFTERAKACDAGETNVRYTRLNEWVAAQ